MNNRILPLAAMLAVPMAIQAEESLSPVVVTATRTAQTVDETLASVTVITREEIEQLQPAQLTDLLRNRAGITVSDNGPFGKASSVYMRGTNSDHTLLLIDGVRMGSATFGGASWQFLPPSEIERIEIVRGPRASVYGADAIGGVIQVFTRQGSEEPARLNAHARIGEFNTREFGAGVQGGTKQTSYSLSASHQETDGINIEDDSGDDGRDGYRNDSLSWSITHRLENATELFTSGLYSKGETDFDDNEYEGWAYLGPYDSAHYDFEHAAARAGLRGSLTDSWFSEFSLAHSRDESDVYYESVFDSRFDTDRVMVDWRNDVALGTSTLLTLGLDWYEDRVSSTTDFDETNRYNRGIYQILQTDLGRHSLQGSLRYDDNEAYGSQTTGQAAWGYALTNVLRSRISYGTAFKAPSFNDLYWPGAGNPELEPEESETVEAGLRYAQGSFHWEASLFQTEVEDLIAWACSLNCDDGDWSTDIWLPQNVHQARIQGLELETGIRHNGWDAKASLSLIDAEDRNTGKELARRPRQTLRLDLDHRIQKFSVGGSVIARGRSYDDPENSVRLAGYSLLNLRTAWHASPDWTVRLSLDNALDKEYETASGYNQPGRAAFLSVRYQQ
ncbi:TonB-dependent receptor domain-containing protein [Thiohalomonas denitrificans]|uniref:Vitamin B12 transporter n=2 Tax=Thiohalomonas denitrificans TaxID=415747 RepID=A0A1G5PMM8_9GAMM|nr:TonB-dependent receptor [Thiohalomonas denitrificans]SCZ50728.1 vitamin B12 transporter [Thiohalomonas denitrificans]